jgi:hypothetical protein
MKVWRHTKNILEDAASSAECVLQKGLDSYAKLSIPDKILLILQDWRRLLW